MASPAPTANEVVTRTLMASRIKDLTSCPCGSPGICGKKRVGLGASARRAPQRMQRQHRRASHWRPPTNKQEEWAHRFPANAATHYADNRQHYQPPQMSHEVIEARQKLAEMGNASRQEAAQILSSCVPPICPHCSSSCCLADGLRGCSRLAVVWLFEYITVRTFHLQLYGRLLQHPEPDCLISNDCSRWQRRAEATRGGGLGPADDAVHTHTIASVQAWLTLFYCLCSTVLTVLTVLLQLRLSMGERVPCFKHADGTFHPAHEDYYHKRQGVE